ncbi:7371_t:CDS:1, partial [Dentiscutata heterogama]
TEESSNIDIDSFAKDFARLKICHVDQKKDDKNWAHKIESNIKELTKAVMDLTEHNRTFNS